ncbi:histidine phosphatase family protein [Pelagibaculum spongiae]|uniref:Histidine phosphatase family protein n=1 Tax=Pelagibaculum spongiae TaxID=2080658 RepID=A0A2V1GZK0_9GAMM|nr:histidine phosphatase family protein [Pelagibaculum spongiae]PVZ70374.1 histidine phosphatase family protein [Pelagibaculum spongiae]
METLVHLIRHGEPAGGDKLRGSTDDPLTGKGWQKMIKAVDGLEYQRIVCSPLLRCQVFARSMAEDKGFPLMVNAAFKERDFGLWDGENYSQLWQKHQKELSDFWSEPWKYQPPEGEGFYDFHQRIEQGWQQLIDRFQGETILLVCHSGVMRALFSQLLNIPLETDAANSRLKLEHGARISWRIWRETDNSGNHQDWPQLDFLGTS